MGLKMISSFGFCAVFQARLFQRVVSVFKQLSKGDFKTIREMIG